MCLFQLNRTLGWQANLPSAFSKLQRTGQRKKRPTHIASYLQFLQSPHLLLPPTCFKPPHNLLPRAALPVTPCGKAQLDWHHDCSAQKLFHAANSSLHTACCSQQTGQAYWHIYTPVNVLPSYFTVCSVKFWSWGSRVLLLDVTNVRHRWSV